MNDLVNPLQMVGNSPHGVRREAGGQFVPSSDGVNSIRNTSKAKVLLPPPLSEEELSAKTDSQGRRVVNRGVGTWKNYHRSGGTLFNIQHADIIKRLNFFFQDKRSEEIFPEGIVVRAHPNGKSLIYEWENPETGDLIRWQQSARPSYQINIKSMFGEYEAEEAPWGFQATKNFDRNRTPTEKATTILHEFLHQVLQIGKLGKLGYLRKHRGEFTVNMGKDLVNIVKDLFKSNKNRQYPDKGLINNAYMGVSLEKEAYEANDKFKKVMDDFRE